MANNYTLWSETLQLSDDAHAASEEREWIEKVLVSFEDWRSNGSLDLELYSKHLESLGLWAHGVSDLEYWPDFDCEVRDREVWVYSEESGNLDNLAIFVQGFLRRFRPEGEFSLQWAFTCSKPRVSEFGGGALVVTPEALISETTDSHVASLALQIKGDECCPYCKSEQISASPFESDTGVAWQVVDCAECGREWKWTYRLHGIELLFDPKKEEA